jgi:hypothetical protein
MSEDRSYEIAKNPPNLPKVPTKVTLPTQVPKPTGIPIAFPWYVAPGAVLIWGIGEALSPQSTSKRDTINPLTKKPYKDENEYKQVEALNPKQKQAIGTLTSTQQQALSNATNIKIDKNRNNCLIADVPNAGKSPSNRAVIEAITGKDGGKGGINPSKFVMTSTGQATIFDVGTSSRAVGAVNTNQRGAVSGLSIPQLQMQSKIASACKFNFTPYSTDPKIVAATAGLKSKLWIVGGPYNTVRQQTNRGEVHHTPADSVVKNYPWISRVFTSWREDRLINDIAPTVWMTVKDHSKTASYLNTEETKAYRAKQDALIRNGDFRGAIQMDINDIQSKFGSKYDPGIKQMLNYVTQLEQRGVIPKSRIRPNNLVSEVPTNAENSTAQNTNQTPVTKVTNLTTQESIQTNSQTTPSMGETEKVFQVNNAKLQEILALMQTRDRSQTSNNIAATTAETNQNQGSITTTPNTATASNGKDAAFIINTSQNSVTSSSTALTGTIAEGTSQIARTSTALTGTAAGSSPTALTGTVASSTALTGTIRGESSKPTRLQPEMAPS